MRFNFNLIANTTGPGQNILSPPKKDIPFLNPVPLELVCYQEVTCHRISPIFLFDIGLVFEHPT